VAAGCPTPATPGEGNGIPGAGGIAVPGTIEGGGGGTVGAATPGTAFHPGVGAGPHVPMGGGGGGGGGGA